MLAVLIAAASALPPAPREALLYEVPEQTVIARAERRSEPVRGLVEYAGALAAFTAVNLAGSMLLSDARISVDRGGNVSLNGSQATLAGAGVCFALSPLAGAVTSWLIGKGSDDWDPSLGWATLGAYGTSLLAVGAGSGLAAMNVDRGAAVAANTAFYLAVPLGTVLLQNATKTPRP